ncbi:FAD/NAD(P)-binding protein [Winogradskyella luteola]|uniref:FAD/NAD(P)-binding protein n=1 Tax=Winogradskyella luteola TaxID=2828330 RepID=A0A9X1JPC9_9FLAO|nr:FAD/NAD(P)-binding protein [Winogradskyella luteola]MBV7270580.1 FAD/NAD(P)-binding protein [Winogradskyella luteola]
MKRLAIIGLGPRGLYALENLLYNLSKSKKPVEILVFEPSDYPGAGTVWNNNQAKSNWINITERELTGIEARPEINYFGCEIKSFPSYHQWCNFHLPADKPDTYPPRQKLGKYLYERYQSIADSLMQHERFSLIPNTVDNVKVVAKQLEFTTKDQSTFICDDILLTIGHQNTELSDQLKSWLAHTSESNDKRVFTNPYPVERLNSLKNQPHLSIGVRGFGLAMIDVARYLAINDYGNFKVVDQSTLKTMYYKVKDYRLKIVPFSLDGLPLAPKPINQIIDSWYQPRSETLKTFEHYLKDKTHTHKTESGIDFLIQSFSKIAADIFCSLADKTIRNEESPKEIEHIIKIFLKDSEFTHLLLQDETIPTYNLIEEYIQMALGNKRISLDYCVWQVWRHCQPTLYKAFSYTLLDDETMNKVINLDERSKRFSYGPPIESMQQILALVDAGILNLSYTNNPDIELTAKGFELKNKNGEKTEISVMINSVLDSPQLLKVNSKIVKSLLQNDAIQPIHSELGIETYDDAYVKPENEDRTMPIAVLGRLAKGSILGVDAILECFSSSVEHWAKSFVENRLD